MKALSLSRKRELSYNLLSEARAEEDCGSLASTRYALCLSVRSRGNLNAVLTSDAIDI